MHRLLRKSMMVVVNLEVTIYTLNKMMNIEFLNIKSSNKRL